MYKRLVYLISVVLVLCLAGSAAGNTFTDAGPTHLWSDPGNWSDGVPYQDGPGKWANMTVDNTICIIDSSIPDANANGFYPGCYGGDNEFYMTGGGLTIQHFNIGRGREPGTVGYAEITGGVINATGSFQIPNQFDLREPNWDMIQGHLDLHGGIINANGFTMGDRTTAPGGGVGTMDVTEGTLIVNGDKTANIQSCIDSGWITAWGGTGTLQLDYNERNPGKTTLTARPPVQVKPYLVNPSNNATGVQPDVVFGWTPGALAQVPNGYDIYIGTSFDAVNDADKTSHPDVEYYNVDANSFGPLSLGLSEAYYWRVDAVNDVHPDKLWKSDVGKFTVADYAIVDDMESYGWEITPGLPGGSIYYTWKDGEGWIEPAPGWGGNGTGAVLELEQTPGITHQSEQAMWYVYDNDGTNSWGTSGLAYYSEAKADIVDLPIGSDWTVYDAKALELWFHGIAGNAATEQMWVALEDTTGTDAVIPYDGSMNDITLEEWKLWRISLQDFVDVDLANVKSIAIGFGVRGNATTPGGVGTVYFDDIRVYPCRPGGLAADFNGDCVVDLRDVAIFVDSWCDKSLWP